jgi:ribosomal protein L29
MKYSEIQTLTPEQLTQNLGQERAELQKMKFTKLLNNEGVSLNFKEKRKTIARILTEMKRRETQA